MGGQSGSWTPTKRRGPIAAEFQGPGPAAIGLPSLFGSKFFLLNYSVLQYLFPQWVSEKSSNQLLFIGQETLDLRYLTLLCDNLKNRMFLQNSTILQLTKCFRAGKIRLLAHKILKI
jgi:hypothetical protein